VLASRVGGIPEVISDGRDGLLVPAGDSDALADAAIRLLADPALRELLGEAGYRTVAERFSIDAQVRRVEEAYDEELARAGVPGAPGAEPALVAPGGRANQEMPPL